MRAQQTTLTDSQTTPTDYETVFSSLVIAVLALATAAIHASLGGMLFLMNGIGYAVLAAAILAPVPWLARERWLVRVALLGFTLLTIGAWILFGARFTLAYVDKAIELALVVFLAIEIGRVDRGIFGVLEHLAGMLRLGRSQRPQAAG